MKRSSLFSYRISGRRALFSDPVNRVGGEKMTYHLPTYQALKGITESIYWKPSFIWFVHRVRVMKQIQTESVGVRPIRYNSNSNDLAFYTYLKDVQYKVEVYFEWNENREKLKSDWNQKKHEEIFARALAKGGRRDIFLGARECQAYVEPCCFEEESGDYDEIERLDFGVQFHSFIYPDEQEGVQNSLVSPIQVNLWKPVLTNGVLVFPRPDECEINRELSGRAIKRFVPGENYCLGEVSE